MPDKHGNFKGLAVSAKAWERIFGPKKCKCKDCTCKKGK